MTFAVAGRVSGVFPNRLPFLDRSRGNASPHDLDFPFEALLWTL